MKMYMEFGSSMGYAHPLSFFKERIAYGEGIILLYQARRCFFFFGGHIPVGFILKLTIAGLENREGKIT